MTVIELYKKKRNNNLILNCELAKNTNGQRELLNDLKGILARATDKLLFVFFKLIKILTHIL